jgi:putative ABC transport system substrate-binding protein
MMGLAFGMALLLGGLFNPISTEAQAAARVARIGFLTADRAGIPYQAFLQGLRGHGYIEGRTVVIEYRSAEGKIERLPALAAAVTVAALAAQQATRTVPFVFGAVSDPVATGLVASFARPLRGCPSSPRS